MVAREGDSCAALGGTSPDMSPGLSQGTCLCLRQQGLPTSLEDDPVVFSRRIPGLEAPGDDGEIDMSWWKVGEAVRRPFTSSVQADWVPCARAQCPRWPCLLTNSGPLG